MTAEDSKMEVDLKNDGLLTGKELIMKRAVSGQRDFPSLGLREYRPTNSWLEKKQIENCLDERLLMVKSERIDKLSDLSVAEWIPDLNKAKVIKKFGKHWDVFGHHKDNSEWLYPEETLFLIEMNILLLFYGEVPVSIEQAYLLLINEDCSLNEYRVFSYLSKRGYKVVRHTPLADQKPSSYCQPDQSEETAESNSDARKEEKKANDSADRPSSPDLIIIEKTIDIIDLERADEGENMDDSKNMFFNTPGSRSWYPRLNFVFSNTSNDGNVKTFKKSDFFDLGYKTKMDILRFIDLNPHSNMIKPSNQRFIPEGIKTKCGAYMIDLKKTKGDVPSYCQADQSEEMAESNSDARKEESKSEKKANDSADRPSSPDLIIIEKTIDIIDLESADEGENMDDSKNMFLNTPGSRSWYPRLNFVFSNTSNDESVKTFKKSDFFDLGYKTKMDILRLIDRNPHSNMIKPPDQRFIPEGIKTKYGAYMIDLKKTKGDVPSASRPPRPRRHFQHGFNERSTLHRNPWENPGYNQPFQNGNNFNNPVMAVMNMMATAMNMLQPQMYNPRPPQQQNFYPRYNRPNNFRNQSRYHHKTNKNNLKREKNKFKPNQPSGLKIITDYVELDDSDEEPMVKISKKDSKIELVDLSEVGEDKSDHKAEVVQLSDNESSEEVVEDAEKHENLTENESIEKSVLNETELSLNEKSETEKTTNWEHFKKAGFNPILDFDKVVSKDLVYKSLEIFEPIETISKNAQKLKISFDAYNPLIILKDQLDRYLN